jgi:hypothetical protein
MLKRDTYFTVVGLIFAVVAAFHLLRILNGWSAQIGSYIVPIWLSWVGFVVASYLSSISFMQKK